MKNLTAFKMFELEENFEPPIGWSGSSQLISREYKFKDFLSAMGFLNGVGEIANRLDHHPKMTIDYDKVLIETYTHDAGRVTDKDLELANLANRLYPF